VLAVVLGVAAVVEVSPAELVAVVALPALELAAPLPAEHIVSRHSNNWLSVSTCTARQYQHAELLRVA
jgi:hypothetical protein